MAALVTSMMASCRLGSAPAAGPLQSRFMGEKLGTSLLSTSPTSSPFPVRVSPQKLQVQALKKIKGKVVCSSNDKTVSVEVIRLYTHPKYKKRIRSSKKYHAHDEENLCEVGDTVILVGCPPISKSKKFRVSEIVAKRKKIEQEGEVELPAFLAELWK